MRVTIDDPEAVERKTIGKDGRVYLGTALAGRECKVTVELVDEPDDEQDQDDDGGVV